MHEVRLQPLARHRVASLGEVGRAWHAGLPAALAGLGERWSLTWGRGLPGGSASYVVAARTADGEDRVVKLRMPDPSAVTPGEVPVLAAAAGQGYAVLHDHDAHHDALLLERLGRSLEQTPGDPTCTLDVLVDTLREAWRLPLRAVPAGEPKALSLRTLVLDTDARLGHPADRDVLHQALAYAEELAAPGPDPDVVVHGDAHPANALRTAHPRAGAPAGHVMVDPDGFRCDPAYDLGVTLREWTARLEREGRPLLEGWCDRVTERSGVDRDRTWRWAYLERVATGLHVLGFGGTVLGGRLLASAGALLDRPPPRRQRRPTPRPAPEANPGPTART
ncbi:aminoglycoside phosphotransferase family protein [Nocardioides aurantiacus]|uniref:aminoglycoside phosphotransferase family protein n=1 Tax=Nocardioides aurantiacus TaxID=86796 RepID=UPI00403F749C